MAKSFWAAKRLLLMLSAHMLLMLLLLVVLVYETGNVDDSPPNVSAPTRIRTHDRKVVVPTP